VAISTGKRHRRSHPGLRRAPGMVLGPGQVAGLGTWATLHASGNAGVQTCANSYCPIKFYAQISERGTISRE